MIRTMLICCEGKTEKAYFDMLARFFRIPGYINVFIIGEKGQHKALIDRAVEMRRGMVLEFDLERSEIECWAVCDDDNMPFSFFDLLHYAEENEVHIAFSRPQFESFLLQHFEQSKATKKAELYERLSHYKMMGGYDDPYDDGTKADLEWMREAIFNKPKIVATAVVNADQRQSQSGTPFLTVQRLVERMESLGK